MRRLVPIAALFVAGCATAPQRSAPPQQPPPAQQQLRGDLLGLTTGELIQRFGRPTLQVREGTGLKLQFRGRCVLDAYLYPPTRGQGPERVTHVDARLPSGLDMDQQSCIAALQRP
jgi:hypothetical protein